MSKGNRAKSDDTQSQPQLADNLDPAVIRGAAELYVQWCRLKGYKRPKSPIEQMIDDATGAEAARMEEFSQWFVNDLLPRIAGSGSGQQTGADDD